jgi:hypothetical protein
MEDSGEALQLWRAIARRVQRGEVLRVLGQAMAERATDRRLDRETRQSLVFSLIVDHLFSLKGELAIPAISQSRIEQLIRTLDDDLRASAADVVRRFVVDLSKPRDGENSPEQLFLDAAMPFIGNVWPKEFSLVTPGVSKAFADLPAACGDEFARAVASIERFLVPFQCWSLLDYGLYGEVDGEPRLDMINTPEKGRALLTLLGKTVGRTEGSTIPHELAAALGRIAQVSPDQIRAPEFQRLLAASRRN